MDLRIQCRRTVDMLAVLLSLPLYTTYVVKRAAPECELNDLDSGLVTSLDTCIHWERYLWQTERARVWVFCWANNLKW